MRKLLLVATCIIGSHVMASANIWPSIPFIRGADLCAYKQAYSQTRMEYMSEMTGMASELMSSGAKGSEALQMLTTFDALYDKNIRLATQGKYLDVTLENTLKGYLDKFYRQIRVNDRKISFRHINGIKHIVDTASRGQRVGYLPENTFDYIDYVAYGSYSFAPNCRGSVQVTLTLVDRDGLTISYEATDRPQTVMSRIASKMFEDFQRTQFPSTVNTRSGRITIIGTMNASVGKTYSVDSAKNACRALGARLPKSSELEYIDSYGDWNGGVSIGTSVWAINDGHNNVYHPGLRNPSPVRSANNINAKEFYYYCVE